VSQKQKNVSHKTKNKKEKKEQKTEQKHVCHKFFAPHHPNCLNVSFPARMEIEECCSAI